MLLKACVNGARPVTDHPRLSADPLRVAEEAAAAVEAGAAAIHLHPKDRHGRDSLAPADVARFVEAARRLCPGIPIGVTTGAWAEPDPESRISAIALWRVLPDFASVNWHEDGADEVAAALLKLGVGVEAGIWHLDGLHAWRRSALRNRCLRALVELPDTHDLTNFNRMARTLVAGIRGTDPAMPILMHGHGVSAWPGVDLAAAMGLDARIGLEDSLHLPDGATATGNADLVRAAIAMLI